jgi:hypothetical protein
MRRRSHRTVLPQRAREGGVVAQVLPAVTCSHWAGLAELTDANAHLFIFSMFVQTYQPNVPEALILVLGIAVAAALINLGEQFLMGDRSQTAT